MMRLLMLVTAAGFASSMSAQQATAPVHLGAPKCGKPIELIGMLMPGAGVVSFVLRPDGRPDTATMAVVRVEHLSVAGFRSVAIRQLSSCQFKRPKQPALADARVLADLTFEYDQVKLVSAGLAVVSTPALALEQFDLPMDSLPLDSRSHYIEEFPRPLACNPRVSTPSRVKMPPPEPISTVLPLGAEPVRAAEKESAARRQDVARSLPSREAPEIKGDLLIRADGSIDRRLHVSEMPPPGSETSVVNRLACQFAPARYRGVPIDSWVRVVVSGNSTSFVFGH